MPAAVAQRRKAAGLPTPSAKKARTSAQPNGTSARKAGLAALVSADGKRVQATTTNGVKGAKQDTVDEARAVVGHGDVDMHDASADPEVVEISSGEEEESELEDSADEHKDEAADAKEGAADAEMAGGDDTAGAEADPPSFGELLRANAPEVVDVEATFQDTNTGSRALAPTSGNRALSAPSATSLGTVLTQALKTNDKELLESCFEMNDLNSVRSTIERLPSPLVANLLCRLAERLHKRPGRAGNLMVWVQWAIVSHGGYLAGRQDIMKELGSLNRVIKERASGLQPLLNLKGKLDMLSAQLELRRSMQKTATMDEDDEEEGVIYVEGQDESDSDEDTAADNKTKAITDGKSQKRTRKPEDDEDVEGAESSDEDGAMNLNAEEEEEEDEGSEDEDVLDDEAEETENDSGEDESEDDLEEIDDDDGEDVSEDDIETPRPIKRSAAAQRMGFGSGRRRR
ncbi:small nucleolar ribonucleoprotein complex component [Diplodia corticola]|uniref:Small nucleolar ribonucleoprotein complex component n=1 Tax=Diplodia corticola TaxID=236234 RepID=A0A1J9RGZ5_9PEZI|nr:small nucleolar ribonucleoprotein complex component [Diplodia corticola]OJD31819.1 small nucleolar ribonucleoprotein complex component [Diplodia corticola]